MRKPLRLKSPDEIMRIHEAGRVLAAIFNTLETEPLDGQTTWELDSWIESMIVKKGALAAFKTIEGYGYASCISVNDEVLHGIPRKKKKLKKGDLVKIDVGVVLRGYFSDACRTFCIDPVSMRAQRLVNAARDGLSAAISCMYPGNTMGDIGSAVQLLAEKRGYSIVRNYTGHGVGYALHESPIVPHYGKRGGGIILKEGMVLAVEPILNEGDSRVRTLNDGWTVVTVDGRLSAQFEHSVAITADGPVILTE